MTKYSLEDKIKAVHNVLELKMWPNAVARSLHTAKAVVQRWVARYDKFGTDGLSMKSGKYSGDFKVRVVGNIHENKGRYGYGRFTLELRNRGYIINHKTVQKLMKQIELKCMAHIKNINPIVDKLVRLHQMY